jgi:hypothetical protein
MITTDINVPIEVGNGFGDNITLGLGIGLGIPTLIATCAGVYWTYKTWKEKIKRSRNRAS